MIKLLIGGSPCTHWSIAQKNNRETTAEGIGWELFKNFLIAKEKFNPDFFLYENNKSAAQPIKDQIAREFGVTERSVFGDNGIRMTYINSALVSAQNRQRFYVTNFGDIEQPADRGILLRDILESGTSWRDKSLCVDANYFKASDGTGPFNGRQSGDRLQVAEPVCVAQRGRYRDTGSRGKKTGAEIDQYYEAREDGKTNALTTVSKDNAVAEPIPVNDIDGKSCTIRATCYKDGIRNLIGNDVDRRTCVAEPIRIGTLPNEKGELHDSQAVRIYSVDGKSVNLVSNGGGQGAKTGLYAEQVEPPACLRYKRTDYAKEIRKGYEDGTIEERMCNLREWHPREDDKSNTLTTVLKDNMIIDTADGKHHPVYEVRNGYITIKDKQYKIKLADGYYIIRKLTVKECCRLQTMPDDYCRAVSNSQAYKGLGNGWTAEVIIHLLNHALKDVPRNEPITVLSMYDGIGTGRYCLDKMGFTNITYYAYEIDKYAIQIAMSNYPDIIQCGDAFQLRQAEWQIRRAG